MLVSQILAQKSSDMVVTIPPGTTVAIAAEVLADKRIGAVIVSEGEGSAPLGILSERDIVRELGRRGTGCLSDTVDAIMTKDPVCCSRSEQADEVLTRMTGGRFRHMPVVEDGQMIGLISIGDVVAARLGELSMEKDALEGMIKGF